MSKSKKSFKKFYNYLYLITIIIRSENIIIEHFKWYMAGIPI
jgi:hypothetical protein